MELLDEKFTFATFVLAEYFEFSTTYDITDEVFEKFLGSPFCAEEKLLLCCAAYVIVGCPTSCEDNLAQELRDAVQTWCMCKATHSNCEAALQKMKISAARFCFSEIKNYYDVSQFLNSAPLSEILTTKEAAAWLA